MADNIKKILTAIGNQVQDLEDALADVLRFTMIDNAFGATLDEIGAIVGEDRNGLEDTPYRLNIIAKIELNASNGEAETIIKAIKKLTNDAPVKLIEQYPAGILCEVNSTLIPPTIVDLIEPVVAGGVRLRITQVIDNPFVFLAEGGLPQQAGGPFSELVFDPVGGGQISELYS